MNLKAASAIQDSEGLCSQSNQLENDSCFDESNLATSAKKKRPQGASGEDNNAETPARRRSRHESNLRRRIYDAWNVLKAASIIVEDGNDGKYFKYNHGILRESDNSD